jgi:hypothetical protein
LTRDDDIVVRLLKKFQMGFGRKLDQHLLQREKYRPVFVGTEGRRSIIGIFLFFKFQIRNAAESTGLSFRRGAGWRRRGECRHHIVDARGLEPTRYEVHEASEPAPQLPAEVQGVAR